MRLPAIWLTDSVRSFHTPGDALDLSLAAELAFGADLARHARHFRGEDRQLLDHRVDELCRAQELAFQLAAVDLQIHGLPEIALGDRADGARHVRGRPHQIVEQGIQRIDIRCPAADCARHRHALLQPAFLADGHAQSRHFPRDAVLVGHGLVESLGNPTVRVPQPTGSRTEKSPSRRARTASRNWSDRAAAAASMNSAFLDLPFVRRADDGFFRERATVVSAMVHSEI